MTTELQISKNLQLTPRKQAENLGDSVEFFLSLKRLELQRKSVKTYTESLNVMIQFFGSDRNVESITQTELIYFFGSIERKPSGVFMVWQTAGFFFRWFYQYEPYNNPMTGIKMKRPKRDPISGIDPQQVEKITKKITGMTAVRDKALILVLFASGLRDHEFCSLKVSDIEPRTGQVIVRTENAKGRKFRTVFILGTALKALNKYLRRIPDADPAAFLWQARSGEPLSESGIRDIITRSCTAAGFPPFSFHDFRRGAALSMHRQGADIKTVSHFLGHADLKTTERYLALQDTDSLNAAIMFDPLGGKNHA